MEKFRVLILGHGEIGQAMEFLLGRRHVLRVWQRRPPPGAAPVALESAVPDSNFVLFCLPSLALTELAARVAPQLRGDTLCLTFAKGLDQQGRLPAEVLTAALGAARTAVLYGPMIAEELLAGKPGFAQCAAPSPEAYERIHALYRDTRFRVEAARDVIGLSWSVILKNVYAIAFGMADELALGDNVRGYLAVTALRELATLVDSLGGEALTPYQLAGLGDLITTATSAGSHHHELGRLIVRGEKDKLQGEGVHTLARLRAAPRFDTTHMPLFRLVDACVQNPDAARRGLLAFLDQPSA